MHLVSTIRQFEKDGPLPSSPLFLLQILIRGDAERFLESFAEVIGILVPDSIGDMANGVNAGIEHELRGPGPFIRMDIGRRQERDRPGRRPSCFRFRVQSL